MTHIKLDDDFDPDQLQSTSEIVSRLVTCREGNEWQAETALHKLLYLLGRFEDILNVDDSDVLVQFATDVAPHLYLSTEGKQSDDLWRVEYQLDKMLPRCASKLFPAALISFRKCVYPELLEMVQRGSESAFSSTRIIRVLGYRDRDTFQKLKEFLSNSQFDKSDILKTLLSLTIPEEDRENFLTTILFEIDTQPLSLKYRIAEQLASQRWITEPIRDALLHAIQRLSADESNDWAESSRTISILSRIARNDPENNLIQEAVWETIAFLCDRFPDRFRQAVMLSSDICSSINFPGMHVKLLEWENSREKGEKEDKKILDWRILDRLSSCIEVDAIKGWQEFKSSDPSLVANIESAASDDTRCSGQWMTIDMKAKGAAWDALLSMNWATISKLATPAIQNETSPHVAQEVYDKLSCYPGMTISQYERNLLRTEHDMKNQADWQGAQDFVRRFGAIRFCSGIPSWDALDVLLTTNFTSNGASFNSTAENAAQIALYLARDDVNSLLNHLWKQIEQSKRRHHRDNVCHVFRTLARQKLLSSSCSEKIKTLISDDTLPEWSTESLIDTLRLSIESVDESTREFVVTLWQSSPSTRVQGAAADVLAHHDQMKLLDQSFVEDRLGITYTGTQWEVLDSERLLDSRNSFTFGLMYENDPSAMENIISQLLRRADAGRILPIFNSIARLHYANSENVIRTLVKRIDDAASLTYAEIEAIELLAHIAPEELVTPDWEDRLNRLHPEARVTFANVLGRLTSQFEMDRLSYLNYLIGDSQYSVRRATFRSLSKLPRESLKGIVAELSESFEIEDRKRAAEACVWFNGKDGLEGLNHLLVDAELDVRNAAIRALDERRERRIATHHVETIEKQFNQNADVSDLYAVGEALTKVGDDEDERRLWKLLDSPDLKPYQRNWITSLCKRIRKHWQEVTRKWPEPWIQLHGTISEKDATLRVGDEKFPCKVQLWARFRKERSELSSWGGFGTLDGQFGFKMTIIGFEGKEPELIIPGMPTCPIILSQRWESDVGKSQFSFSGNGPYPGG